MISARRDVVCARLFLYFGVADQHLFFIATCRAVVDDGQSVTSSVPVFGCAGGRVKVHITSSAFRDLARLPDPHCLWSSSWVSCPKLCISEEDIYARPCSTGPAVALLGFLFSLHWPSKVVDLGVGGCLLL